MSSFEQYESLFLRFISEQMKTDSAHDISHIKRVVKTAKLLANQEKAQLDIVVPAAYLHDCVNLPKDHPDRHLASQLAADKAVQFLIELDYPSHTHKAIYHAISAHSYSANISAQTIEAKVVQDADRLDALGAIGIARCIQVSTQLSSSLYQAQDPFADKRELDDKRYCIDHFFSKLFKLPQTMQTKSGQKEGTKRAIFMRQYLNQLRQEIE
ncbi:HD domain-containing protein [Vibrio gallicus]|uniref:HD domain-containing protein n=1 Tax=Vibrio gallicus TaxID=190897 RepID=UPI0021C360D3|nr:HD domain-containing protein [Vibrio gallicus]